ncbi:hypothetical protein BCO9919_07049 [Burkholderia cenocepacia]|uniref:Uncharacterized protein n=1 Tax=Burkholderia cenocepacia TaxID=95486 RepID=A0A6J5JUT4_9BURK|nr:hypothetical protein BCO9919_07049 [Burkholderia cenocepacia]
MGEAVGAQVEFGVGERGVIEDGRDGIGRALDLLFEQPMQRLRGGFTEIRIGAVPLDRQLVPLRVARQRQRAERRVRIGDHGIDERAEVFRHAIDRGGVEQVEVVFQRAREAVVGILHMEREVELRGVGLHRHRRGHETGEAHRLGWRFLVREHDLEHRRAAQVALERERIHHLLERNLLAAVAVERDALHARQQFAEGRIAGQVHAQREHVREEADQRLGHARAPVGDRGADDEVLLVAVSRQEQRIRGEHDHERAGAGRTRDRAQAVGAFAVQLERQHRAAELLDGGPRAVGGQFDQVRRIRQRGAQQRQFAMRVGGREAFVLPHRVVRVLDSQFRQRLAGIECGQLTDEDA